MKKNRKSGESAMRTSQFQSSMGAAKVDPISFDKDTIYFKLFIEKWLSQKQASFALRLTDSLSSSKFFQGTATLQQPQKTSSGIQERVQHAICYSYTIFCGDGDKAQIEAAKQVFKKRAEFIHSKLQEFIQRYRIQNRIGYWIGVLQKTLNKQFVKECPNRESGQARMGQRDMNWRDVDQKQKQGINKQMQQMKIEEG